MSLLSFIVETAIARYSSALRYYLSHERVGSSGLYAFCGVGVEKSVMYTFLMEKAGEANLTLMDIDPLKIAQAKRNDIFGKANYVVGDIRYVMTLAPGPYDIVFAAHPLSPVEEYVPLMDSTVLPLSRGGIFFGTFVHEWEKDSALSAFEDKLEILHEGKNPFSFLLWHRYIIVGKKL